MRSFVRHVAVACVAFGALPQFAAVAQSVHVLVEHEHMQAPIIDATPTVLHGHTHSAGTPEHDHPATTSTSVSVASHARGPLQLPALVAWGSACSAWHPASQWVSGDRLAFVRTTQVLSVVLRI